ncbi:MAG: hypothetical protein IE937_10740 [Gammaproteobacteria bacterium]|nr:hypothetical protein [Gammaproteobacteria bacterium]
MRKKRYNPDKEMWATVTQDINKSVPWYLMSAYAYYELDDPFLTDASFDALAKFMLENWDEIEHRHKHLITEGDLEAGTLLNREFPLIVKGAAQDVIKRKEASEQRKVSARR